MTDVSKLSDLRNLVDMALTAHGHIDVVVNNAGIVYAGDVDSVDPAEAEPLMKVNVAQRAPADQGHHAPRHGVDTKSKRSV